MSKSIPGVKGQAAGRLGVEATSSTLPKKTSSSFDSYANEVMRPRAREGTREAIAKEFSPSEEYSTGTLVNVPLDLIDENPINPRVFFQDDELQSLASSMEARGQLESAKAYFLKDKGRFKLKNGHRRFRALQDLGFSVIRVEVVEKLDELEEFLEARDINNEAKGHTYLDDSVRFLELMERFNLNQRSLSIKLKMSEGDVSKRLKIGVLPREILEFIAKSGVDIGQNTCYRIALLYERAISRDSSSESIERADSAVYDILQAFLDGKMTYRKMKNLDELENLEEVLGNNASKEVARRASVLRRVKIESDESGDLAGSFRVYPDKLQLEVKGLSQEARESLSDKLIEFLEENKLSKSS